MEFFSDTNEIKLFCLYKYITGDNYLTSQIDGKENILVYISYLLKQLGFDLGRYKYYWDESCGVYSSDLVFKIKFFKEWGKVSSVDLVVSEYIKTEIIRNISEMLKGYVNTSYSYKDYLGCIASIYYIQNQNEIEEKDLFEYLESNSPYVDEVSNTRALTTLNGIRNR